MKMKALAIRKGASPLTIPTRVVNLTLKNYQKGSYMKRKMEENWPISQRMTRQMITERVGVMQAGKQFDTDLYHHTYERYLGYKSPYNDVYKLVQKRCAHWTEILECKDPLADRTLMEIKNELQQVGVDLSGADIESYTTWLVFILSISKQYLRNENSQQQISDYLSLEIPHWDPEDSEWFSVACSIAICRSETENFREILKNMIENQSLFSVRAYQLLTVAGATQHDIVNGPDVLSEVLDSFNVITKLSTTYAAVIHASLEYYAKTNKCRSFLEIIKIYNEFQSEIGLLSPNSIHLIFLFWMHNHSELDTYAISVILKLFASWKLPDHVTAIISEYKKSGKTDQLLTTEEYESFNISLIELQNLSNAASPVPVSSVASNLSSLERSIKRAIRRRQAKKIPREKVEAACVRELLQDAPFGGDRIIQKYIRIANM